MAKDQFTLAVELDGGAAFEVLVDQRDLAALEATDHIGRKVTRIRFLAWSAAKRSGQYAGSWDRWNETDCIEVGDPPDGDVSRETSGEGGEGEQRLNPGRRSRSGTGSST